MMMMLLLLLLPMIMMMVKTVTVLTMTIPELPNSSHSAMPRDGIKPLKPALPSVARVAALMRRAAARAPVVVCDASGEAVRK